MKNGDRNNTVIEATDEPHLSSIESSNSRHSEETRRMRLYETLLSNTPDLIFVFGLDHRFTYANEPLLQMWGTSWDEAIGKNCLELGYEEWQAEKHDHEIDTVIATKQPIRGELPFTGTNGRRIYDYFFVPVLDPNGEVEAISGTARDITERKEAEEEIARLGKQNSEILESLSEAFFAVDRDWRFTYINRQTEQLLGRTREEMLGKVIWDIYPEAIGTEFEQAYQKAMNEGVDVNVTAYYPDHARWYEVHAFPATNGITVYGRDVTEAKLSETALRESEQRLEQQARIFDTTLSSISDFAYTLTNEGKFLYANQPMLDLLGITLDEIIGKSFEDLNNPPELVDRLMSQIRHVVKTGESVRDEAPFTSPGGYEGFYEYIFSPVRDADGSVKIIGGSTRDTSQRSRMEEALRMSEERYRGIVNQTGAGIAEINLDGYFRTVNKTFCDITGYSEEELLSGIRVQDITHEDDLEHNLELIKQLFEDKKPFRIEKRYYRKDGGIVWVRNHVSAVTDISGEIHTLVAVVSDLTDRKRAEEQLQKAVEFDEAVMKNMSEGLYTVDPAGNLLSMNPEAERVFGQNLADVQGRNFHDVIHYLKPDGKTCKADACSVLQDLINGKSVSGRQEIFLRGDGTFFDAVYSSSPIVIDGELTASVIVFRDVTEEKRAENSLRESERRFRLMADSSPSLIWIRDRENRFSYFNRTWLDFTGRKPNESINDGWGQSVHPEDFERCYSHATSAFEVREEFEMEYRLRRHDGGYRWVLDRAVPVFAAPDDFRGYIGSCTDIHELKRVESELRLSEEKIRIAVEAAHLVTWEWDLVNDQVSWNDVFFTIFDDTTLKSPANSEEFFRVLHINDLDFVRTEISKAVAEEAVIDLEFRTKRPDDTFRWISTYGQVTEWVGGRAVRLSGVASDITRRKRAEEELRDSEQMLQAIYDGTNEYIVKLDPDGILLNANRASLEFGPSELHEEIGRLFWETIWFRFTPGAPEMVKECVVKAASGESMTFHAPVVTPDGISKIFEISFCPTFDENGMVVLIVAEGRDITEQKAAEDVLRQQAALIELSYEPIFVWDFETGIVEWNKGAEKLYGFSRDEALGKQSHVLLQTLPKEAIIRMTEELEKSGYWSGEVKHFTKDGREVIIESRLQLVNSQGRKLILESDRDITERTKAATLLERYRLLSEKSRDAIWFLSPDFGFLEVNQAALDLYGYTHEEFLTMKLMDIRHPSTLNQFKEQFKMVNEKGVYFETEHVKKDGTRFSVDVTANSADFGGNKVLMAIVRDISDRKKAEQSLLESEERRKLAQKAGNVGIWDCDFTTGITYWSETMWSFYGEQPSDINPDEEYWIARLHPNDRERAQLKIHKTLSSEDTRFNDEFRIMKTDGSSRWIESIATISRNEKGEATRMYGVNIDITERKQTEEKIRLSENQLRLVTNAVPALISYVDSNECFRYVNQKFTEWFGTSMDELVGKQLRDVVGPQAYRVIKPQVDEALSGVHCAYETVLSFKGAGTRYVHMSYMPDMGVDGTIYGYYGLTHDLTDLKRSQDLLRSSEERLAMMIESLTHYAIFFMNSDGLIDTWNRGAEIIFGYAQDEVIGHSYEILFTADDIENGVPKKELQNVMEKGRASDDLWYQRKDGTRFYANGVMMPLFVGTKLTGYAKIASDLTEKQRHADELQRAHDELDLRVKDRTKELAEANLALVQEMEDREIAERQRIDLLGRLVTSQEFERRRIARDLHDQLGQRLTALRLKIASLREMSVENSEIIARVERLQEIAEQIDSEVSFLAWELRPSALDDLGLVEAVGAFVKEWSRHVEIPAEFHSSGLLAGRLNHDTETHLYRITQEALNNITKHAAATNVTVMLERRDDNVILIVEDNGTGFEPAQLRVSNESGSGLGLVGMKERATLIEGEIEIESAVGQGTTIYVRIPLTVA